MQRNGLEWLYRLAREPRRLAGRYLINNPLFLAGLVRQKLFSGSAHDRAANSVSPPRLRFS
jgi:UDP-N-acetyl-D-mannosaminuronic acid transferase (WecB/TagA/CpsF family)